MNIQFAPHRECSVLPLEGANAALCVGETIAVYCKNGSIPV